MAFFRWGGPSVVLGFTRKKPSMAFFRWGGPSVVLGFTPEKPFHESIEPAVTSLVAAGSFIFCDSSPADAGACGVACRVSIGPHFALHSAADLTGVVASASAALPAPAVPPLSGKTVMPLVNPDHGCEDEDPFPSCQDSEPLMEESFACPKCGKRHLRFRFAGLWD